jgi:transposase
VKVVDRVKEVWRTLNRRLRRELNQTAMWHTDVGYCMRCKIVRNLVKGYSPQLIHKYLGCSVSQVYRVAHRFVQELLVGLADKRDENGERKVDDAVESIVWEAVMLTPQDYGFRRPTWTQELFVLVVAKKFGLQVSCTTMSRLLKRLGIRFCRSRPVVHCPWPKRRKNRRLRTIRRMLAGLAKGEVALYVDEIDIHLNPKIGPDWTRTGIRKEVVTPGQNKKHYLAGALNAKTGRLTWVEAEKKNSDLFIRQLWQLVKRDYPEATHIHVILDNFSIHKSRRTKLAEMALKDKVTLHFLPPYCPNENRIERIWKDLHDNVTRNHRCQTMTKLMREVRAYLRIREKAGKHQYALAT